MKCPQLTIVAVLFACLAVSPGRAIPRPIADTEWSLSHFLPLDKNNTKSILPNTSITLLFGDDGTQQSGPLSGNAGCNSYSGDYTVDVSTRETVMKDLAWTEVYCIEPSGLMEQETEYLKVLAEQQVFVHFIYGDKLELYDEDGNLVLSFVPLDDVNDVEQPTEAQENATALHVLPVEQQQCADVISATATEGQSNTYTISATISSPYEVGWDKYADAFQVRTPSGDLLGTRVLAHPHVNEQPFTRSLSGVVVPDNIDAVVIAAQDSMSGYCGEEFELILRHETTNVADKEKMGTCGDGLCNIEEGEDCTLCPTDCYPCAGTSGNYQGPKISSEGTESDDPLLKCSLCTSYYPTAMTTTPISDRGELAPLTRHACGQEITTGCCKPYRPAGQDGLNACGVYWNEEFLYPCDECPSVNFMTGQDGEEKTSSGVVHVNKLNSLSVLAILVLKVGFLLPV